MGYQGRRRQRLRRALRPSLPALALLLAVPDAAPAAARESQASGPDFSAVTTRAAADRLVRSHKLMKILFFPAEPGGGGPADPGNIGYIAPQAVAERERVIGAIGRLIERDQADRLEATADCKGASIVPSRIRLKTSHGRSGQSFYMAVEVW